MNFELGHYEVAGAASSLIFDSSDSLVAGLCLKHTPVIGLQAVIGVRGVGLDLWLAVIVVPTTARADQI